MYICIYLYTVFTDEPECDHEFDFNYEKKDNLTDASIRDMVCLYLVARHVCVSVVAVDMVCVVVVAEVVCVVVVAEAVVAVVVVILQ